MLLKNKSRIILKNIQIKSIGKAKLLAAALDIIEKECGIHEVLISIDNSFICPDIDLRELGETAMENCLLDIINNKR